MGIDAIEEWVKGSSSGCVWYVEIERGVTGETEKLRLAGVRIGVLGVRGREKREKGPEDGGDGKLGVFGGRIGDTVGELNGK